MSVVLDRATVMHLGALGIRVRGKMCVRAYSTRPRRSTSSSMLVCAFASDHLDLLLAWRAFLLVHLLLLAPLQQLPLFPTPAVPSPPRPFRRPRSARTDKHAASTNQVCGKQTCAVRRSRTSTRRSASTPASCVAFPEACLAVHACLRHSLRLNRTARTPNTFQE
eukprot:3428592-Rhodomonas_salina.1